MSGDQLDLDALREQLGDFMTPMSEVQKIGDALVAEVRRLRDIVYAEDVAIVSAESVEYLTTQLAEYRGRMRAAESEVERLRAAPWQRVPE